LAGIEGGIRGFMLKNISVLKPFISGKLRKDPLVMSTLSNTVTLTNIFNPAGSANQIAQETTASLDCRLLPGFPVQKFLSKIRKSASNENATVRIIHQSQDAGPSELKDHYYRLSESLKKAYPECEIIPILFPATTDNNYFRKYDIPTYGINPVCFDKEILKTIHNEDERISIDNLEKGIMVYYDILQSALKDQMNLLTRKADLLNYSAK
ncbi:MAG TPA: M20/M25/M40 family metallo-hydrolase, partial [Cyclobacteriaceae bacterium]|nr:M20/M25/M40 family metallo-hydrolase [Cyclobacteriaceae bacterium]